MDAGGGGGPGWREPGSVSGGRGVQYVFCVVGGREGRERAYFEPPKRYMIDSCSSDSILGLLRRLVWSLKW